MGRLTETLSNLSLTLPLPLSKIDLSKVDLSKVNISAVPWTCTAAATSAALLTYFLWPKRWYPDSTGPSFRYSPFNKLANDMITSGDQIHIVAREACEKYGEFVWFNALGNYYLVVGDPELVRAIVHDRKSFENPPEFRASVNYHTTGSSMFSTEGELWKVKHDILQPMLKAGNLRKSSLMVYRKASQAIDIINQMTATKDSVSIDLSSLFRKLTIDVIGDIAFGTDFNTLGSTPEEMLKIHQFQVDFEAILAGINFRSVAPRATWFPHFFFRNEQKNVDSMLKFFRETIEKRKEETKFLSPEEEPYDLISLVTKFKEENPELGAQIYPEINILTECISFFGAGHDTTTNTISILFHHLIKYPHVQKKVREEFKKMMSEKANRGEDTNVVSYDDIQSLHYLNNVIKESQRTLPVITSLLRHAVQDTEIKGVQFKKGTSLLLNTWYIYSSPKYFHDPEQFLPERWEEEGAQNLPFFPFGHGSRICFGQKLALMEIKMAVLMVLNQYEILEDPSKPIAFNFKFGVTPVHKQTWIQLKKLPE